MNYLLTCLKCDKNYNYFTSSTVLTTTVTEKKKINYLCTEIATEEVTIFHR